jgi:hypothetical protein
MVHRWLLARFSLLLGDTNDQNDDSGQWQHESPVDTWVDPPIFRWLAATFLPILVNASTAFP